MILPKPQGIQIEVLDLPPKGHNVILGTAGSGKTTLAIYRAYGLARLDENEKVLLVTFNTTLVKYLEAIADDNTINNIDVRNYHKFARGYLASRGKMPAMNGIVSGLEDGDNKKLILIRKALQNVILKYGENSTLRRSATVFLEEINWIEKMGLSSLSEYEIVERVGRSDTRILRENRKFFFMVYEEYLRVREKEGYMYDWEDMATTVYEELLSDNGERMYKHIVIDEGQDLSPMMLKSLVQAIPEEGSLTFFGDVAQQIYGGRLSWRDAGLKIEKKKIWRFDRNYRNSKEIARFAIEISKLPYFINESDLVEPIMPLASSPLPAVVHFDDEEKELRWIVNTAIKNSNNESVAILVRNREAVDYLEKLLKEKGNIPQILKNGMRKLDVTAKISIGTYHSAKGLEFDMVLLPGCSKERLPGKDKIEALEGRNEALKEDIKLIYVAVTRAKRGLIISYTGEKTELLPEQKNNLFIERNMV